MKETFRHACRPSVVKRALLFAVILGAILIAINHVAAVFCGDLRHGRLLKMAPTALVSNVVFTLSSVGAMCEKARASSPNS